MQNFAKRVEIEKHSDIMRITTKNKASKNGKKEFLL